MGVEDDLSPIVYITVYIPGLLVNTIMPNYAKMFLIAAVSYPNESCTVCVVDYYLPLDIMIPVLLGNTLNRLILLDIAWLVVSHMCNHIWNGDPQLCMFVLTMQYA